MWLCASLHTHGRQSPLANLALPTRSVPVLGTFTTQMQQIKAVVFDVRIHLIHPTFFILSNSHHFETHTF